MARTFPGHTDLLELYKYIKIKIGSLLKKTVQYWIQCQVFLWFIRSLGYFKYYMTTTFSKMSLGIPMIKTAPILYIKFGK